MHSPLLNRARAVNSPGLMHNALAQRTASLKSCMTGITTLAMGLEPSFLSINFLHLIRPDLMSYFFSSLQYTAASLNAVTLRVASRF